MAETPARRSPSPAAPNITPGLGEQAGPGLAQCLQPSVDAARQLITDLGLRPYTAHSVIYRWTGGERSRGEPVVVSDTAMLPTPELKEWSGTLRQEVKPAGNTTRGTATLQGISGRYTEDDIRHLFFLQPLPSDHEGFIEIRKTTEGDPMRRRFQVRGVPFFDPMKFEWRVRLQKQDENRSRAGVPFDVKLDTEGYKQAVFFPKVGT